MRHEIRTTRREELVDVTEVVARAVAAAGVSAGVAVVSSPHTTAGILVNENADPDVATDLIAGLARTRARESPAGGMPRATATRTSRPRWSGRA